MNIALCLSGFPRNYKETFSLFKKHLLDVLHPDIFFYGYNQKAGEFDNEFVDKFKFTDYIIKDYTEATTEEIDTFSGNWDGINLHCSTRFSQLKSQFYNIYKSNQLKNQFEKNNNKRYDIVIRARFEAFFIRDVNLEEIEKYPQDTIAIPYKWNFKEVAHYGVTDQFAIGNKKNMDIYSSAIKKFKTYNLDHNIMCHPETLMGYHLHFNKVKVNEIETYYEWERQDGRLSIRHSEQFSQTEKPT